MSRTVLVYHDTFDPGRAPAEIAATRLGWPVLATNDRAVFATEYARGGWDIVVVDSAGSDIGSVRDQVMDRVSSGDLIFSWWDLDSDPALAAALGVRVLSYDNPHPIYRASGSPFNLFNRTETFPEPLTSSHDMADNGDYLTLTAGGRVLLAADSPAGRELGALTNSGRTIVLGFLPADYETTDNDRDGVPDMVEMYVNLLLSI